MKNIKIFPKMFIQIFSVLGTITILTHLLVFFIFPKTYLETRKEEIYTRANEISASMDGRKIENIEEALKLYSESSEIKAYVKSSKNENEVPIGDININLEGSTASLRLSLLVGWTAGWWVRSLSYDYLRLGAFLRIATR